MCYSKNSLFIKSYNNNNNKTVDETIYKTLLSVERSINLCTLAKVLGTN